ncbi:winged helix-turn-helix transcriptional regulator [Acidihalobacter prosperus]|uniref:Transcriptional regulator n=1 Tax=Acidihalobacter prosperus TaxID=160660 RepID=A0A1A6C471_9GAMM|nr:response regulator transcription factor [Acidihalobacter prosperus]OBS09361.1 transcriptional regulator [Acidihalobacter prosperus]
MQLLLLCEPGHSPRRLITALRTRCESINERPWPEAEDDAWPHAEAVIMHGFDDRVVEHVAAARARAGKAALLVVAPLSHSGRLAALEHGADDCLPDDTPGQTLHQRLLALHAITPAALNEGHCVVGDLRIGLSSVDVWRGDRHLRLGMREYQLLRLLALNADRTLSRGELVERVWGIEADPNDNVLDVYVHRLRSKVDKPFAKPLIQTVRGIGYRLAED